MKAKILIGIVFFSSFLMACGDKNEINDSSYNAENDESLQSKNEALAQFGNEFIESIKDEGLRTLLKEEIGKKFDYQYDIVYDFIEDKEISTTQYKSSGQHSNSIKLKSLFSKELKIKDKNIFKRPVQISVPVHFEDWDPTTTIPPVVILPADFDEDKYNEVDAVCHDGTIIKLSTQTPPTFPVILISEAERVDENNKLIVDENGIVVANDKRVNALDAYIDCDKKLKSAVIVSDPLICIYEDSLPIIQEPEQKSISAIQFIGASSYPYSFDQLIEDNAVIQAPDRENISLTYSAANRIELDWPAISGASGYYVAYMGNMDWNWKYIFFPTSKAIFAGLDETKEYSFQIHSVKGQYCSDNSTTQSKIVSGRNKNQVEYIDKIYISKNYFRLIEFWGFQHCELDIRATKVDENKVTHEITDDRPFYVIRDNDVQGKTYHNHHYLFNWDVDVIGQSYALSFIEHDGSGSWGEVIASVELIAKDYIPSQYKTVWDKSIGTFKKVYEIAAADEEIGTLNIKWHQPNSQRCEVHGSSFVVTMDHDKDGSIY